MKGLSFLLLLLLLVKFQAIRDIWYYLLFILSIYREIQSEPEVQKPPKSKTIITHHYWTPHQWLPFQIRQCKPISKKTLFLINNHIYFFRYSPSVTYKERKTRGSVVATFGREKLRSAATFKSVFGRQVEFRLWGEQEGWMSTETRYMYEVLGRKAEVLNGITNWLGEALKEKYFIHDTVFAPFEKISLVG